MLGGDNITDDFDELDAIYWHAGSGAFFSYELGPILLARFFMLDDPTIMRIRVFQLNQYEEYADDYNIARYVDFMYGDRVPAIDFATQIPIQSGESTNPGMAVHYGNIHGGTYLGRNLGITSLATHVGPSQQDLIDEYVPEGANVYRQAITGGETLCATYVAWVSADESESGVALSLYYPHSKEYQTIEVDLVNGSNAAMARSFMDTVDEAILAAEELSVLFAVEIISSIIAIGAATVSAGMSMGLLALLMSSEVYGYAKQTEQRKQKLLTYWFIMVGNQNNTSLITLYPTTAFSEHIYQNLGYDSLYEYYIDGAGVRYGVEEIDP